MTPKEKAQEGISLLKEAVIELLQKSPNQRSIEIARNLGIVSSSNGKHKNWVIHYFLKKMVADGNLTFDEVRKTYQTPTGSQT
ncbi:MAG: hypothetical protein KF734_13870 [Saprospiraceae bacterium]|nr:hypothetical protein [Saprospiraceae bacterium]